MKENKESIWSAYDKEVELDEYFDSHERQKRYGFSESVDNYNEEECAECIYQGCKCELHHDDWEEC